MIPVANLTTDNEPGLFDTNCRKPGAAWLTANPDKDPHDQSGWWSQFKPDLAKHFNYRCGCNDSIPIGASPNGPPTPLSHMASRPPMKGL